VTARQLVEAMSCHLDYYGPTFVGPGLLTHGDLNELEHAFYEYVARYEPYWSEEPIFDCGNTLEAVPHLPCPPVDEPLIGRLIAYAVQDRWGKRRK
jgi:hypothetical protein